MDYLTNIYQESLAGNEKNINFWENYIQSLKSIIINTFSDKLKVPVLVPIGSKILFRGDLIHTNEVTVALGADYFVKCSLTQAEILRQHRLKDAESKLETYRKEKEFLENQLAFSKNTVFDNEGEQIIEVHTEEEDKAWRIKHRENVKKYKQSENKQEDYKKVTDAELWGKLDELELQEELENELAELKDDQPKEKTIPVKEPDITMEVNNRECEIPDEQAIKNETKVAFKTDQITNGYHPDLKLDLLQKVLDKQNELEEKLLQLKNKERSDIKTRDDFLRTLDKMEELDELEDEMDRLDDILETDDIEESEEGTSASESTMIKRKVSFADEDDSDTIELSFQHTDIEPSLKPYDPAKGIQKPSDIYEAFSHLFNDQTVSILKKSKYTDSIPTVSAKVNSEMLVNGPNGLQSQRETIVVKDVIEKIGQKDNQFEDNPRPVSIFKKRRQQRRKL